MSKRPSHGRMALPQLGVPVWYSPLRWSLPFWGSASPPGTMCLRKSGPPQRGVLKKPPRVRRVLPCQVGRKYRQGCRQSSFPFSGRTFTGSPSEYKRFPPLGENPETHGAPAGQDSVPQGGSQGRARSAVEKSRIASKVINSSLVIHVGLNNSE